MAVLDEIEAAIPALRRYAIALLRDRDAADDLVQDALERAVRRRADLRGEGKVLSWLFAILLNLVRDRHRHLTRSAHLVPIEAAADQGLPPAQDGSLALTEVHAAMGRLPLDQRAVLLLVALEGRSLAEAARALGVTEGTAASRLGRARAALRVATGRDRQTGTGGES